MSRTASPWDALLRCPPVRVGEQAVVAADACRAGTKLAGLLTLLAERDSASTLVLAVCADLTSRQVWGLLKAPRARGQVTFTAGRWQLVRDYAGRDVERAAALLRSMGWQVEPPRAHASAGLKI